MKGKLFEYVVIHHPKVKKAKDGEELEVKKSKIVTDVTRVLAADDKEVGILAARGIPENLLDELANIEIIIRPF